MTCIILTGYRISAEQDIVIWIDFANNKAGPYFDSTIIAVQGFSCLSKSGSRGGLIWEKQLTNIHNWENLIGETQ